MNCADKNLTRIPNDIPLTTRVLDLSSNPLLEVQSDSFVNFTKLFRLTLRDCNLNIWFKLPRNLKEIDLAFNFLRFEDIEQIFSDSSGLTIERINLRANKIQLGNRLSVFPNSTMYLRLDDNILNKIGNNDLITLRNLREIKLGYADIRSIGEGAFRPLSRVEKIWLSYNFLSYLPNGLFQSNHELTELDLEGNNLTKVPDMRGVRKLIYLRLVKNRIRTVKASDFHIGYIFHIDMASNGLESFDFNGINLKKLDLSNNRILEIKKGSFGNNTHIFVLLLQRNKIKQLSMTSFQGIEYINELHLQRNDLHNVANGTFQNMSIDKLHLFNNNLTSMAGILEGMKTQPKQLFLFGNKIQFLRSTDFQHMDEKSTIYLSCDSFKEFSSPLILKAKLVCSPFKDLVIQTATTGLEGNGFRCEGVGQLKCYPCKQGEYDPSKDHVGENKCEKCPAGAFYQDEMASLYCKQCPVGQYVSPDKAPGKGPLDCLTCPEGTNTNSSSGYRACFCFPGYFRNDRFGRCYQCTQVGFECKKDYPNLKRGYWMSWDSKNPCKESFVAFMSNLDTKDNTYDRGTTRFTCDLPMAHQCPLKDSCNGGVDASCSSGYTGVLCAVCQPGFMRQFKKCVQCPSPIVSVLQLVAYFSLFIFICWLMSRLDKMKLVGDKSGERSFADLIQSSLKILMGFYQVLIRIIDAFSSIHWPTALTKAVNIFEYVQFSVLRIPSLHCIRSNWRLNAINEFWISLASIIVIPSVILLYFAIKALINFCLSKHENFRDKFKESCKNCLQSIVLFLFATYPLISTSIFRVLPASCHTFCMAKNHGECINEISYLRSDYSVKCTDTSNDHNYSFTYGYISLIFPLGLPCMLLYLLWKFAPKKGEVHEARSEADTLIGIQEPYYAFENEDTDVLLQCSLANTRASDTSVVAAALKMTYGNYKESCWYWEFLEMIRKLLINITSSFLLQNVKIGLYGNILLSIIFALLHARKWPMKDSFDNYMQLLALVSVTLNLCYSVTKTSSIGDADIIESNEDVFGLGLMLVILNSLLFVLIVGRFVKEIVLKIIIKMKSFGCSCCTYEHCCSLLNCKKPQ